MELNKDEKERYQRHLILPGFGENAQLKLKSSSVLVIGAGGLGCPVLTYLTASGFGKIGIVDDDVVNLSNLHRQTLFSAEDVGKPKVATAVECLRKNNPFVKFKEFNFRLTRENALEVINEFDFVIDGTDNFSTRYLVNDACVLLNKPLISGSIYTFEGQVSVFNYKNGPTYRCLFPEAPAPEDMPNCSEIGVLGILPGVVGSIMATEAVKVATGLGEVLSGKLLTYDALNMNFHVLGFSLNPENKNITSLSQDIISCSVTQEITSAELKRIMSSKEDFDLIDVRETEEYEAFNIGGINYPLSNLNSLLTNINPTKKKVVHCKSGIRSKKAIDLMSSNGIGNLFNLKNGLQDWS